MNLKEFYETNNTHISEGHSQEVPQQVEFLLNAVTDNIKSVLEIGFNAGHSAELFLSKGVSLTSVDIGTHETVKLGEKFLNEKYNNKLNLLIGNSKEVLPTLNDKYDLIFIDGGHYRDIIQSDLDNCKKLSHNDTLVIVDDVIQDDKLHESWTRDPTAVWNEFIDRGEIQQLGFTDYRKGRGQVWGKFILQE